MPVLMPQSLKAACDLLSGYAAVPIAGGTDLLVHWPERLEDHQKTFLDLSALDELRPLCWSEDCLILGGLTTYWEVIQEPRIHREFPLLLTAAQQVGAVQIQARGTWAGNIANASPAADGVLALLAYDAVVELVSRTGIEAVPLGEFYLGYKQMRRRPDQLIQSIRLPRRPATFEFFEKVGSRAAQAITKVGVAIVRSAAGWRVAANSVAPFVCRLRHLEQFLTDELPVRSPDDLLPALRADVKPIDDLRSTALYRETVLARVLYSALGPVCPSFIWPLEEV